MQNLEQTVKNGFLDKVGNGLRKIKHSVAGRIAVYSLVGILSAGLGYGCAESSNFNSSNPSVKYGCNNNQCVEDFYGHYAASDCDGACAKETGEVCWDKTFGGSNNDRAYSIQQTTEGGYIVAGETDSGAGWVNAWVLKLDSNGDLDWDKIFEGNAYTTASVIQQTTDLGYIVAGSARSKADDYNALVLKLGSNGDLEWDRTFGGSEHDTAFSIQQTTDGGYIVAGDTISKGAGESDAWILKLDSTGELEWDKTFGGSDWDNANSIQQTTDGGYIVAGNTESKGAGGSDAWVLKLDSNGEIVWDKTFGGSEYDRVSSIQQTNDNGYIVAGGIYSSNIVKWSDDALVLKFDSTGELEWDKTYGESDMDHINSIQQTTEGGYIVAGLTWSKSIGWPDNHAWILKLDSNGNLEWDKTFGGSEDDEAYSIQQTKDGGYIVAGDTRSKGAGGADAWVFKLDKNGGNLDCE